MRYVRLARRPAAAVFSLVLALSLVLVTGCDSAGSNDGRGDVAVSFGTSYSAPVKNGLSKASANDSIVLTGSNGSLTIDDIRLIVSELELEGEDDSSEFEAEPTFLDLPLDTTDIAPIAAGKVPNGTYTEFEFEVEDVEFGEAEDDDDDEEALRALRAQIRNTFPDWPNNASMIVVGSFTPDGGTAQSFATYFEAEIEVERTLNPPLEVTGSGFSRDLTVRLDPAVWFIKNDGSVWDLSQSDYQSTGELVEFEAEFENGVTEIEIEDDDDDDDNDDDGDDD